MVAFEMTLLFDYYGELLTQRQRMCFDLRYNQDMSLAEIAEELQVSRQGVYDNLCRAEALLKNMEEKTGCVSRDMHNRKVADSILKDAQDLMKHPDAQVKDTAGRICSALQSFKE